MVPMRQRDSGCLRRRRERCGGQSGGQERRQADILVANDRVVDDVQCAISE
jgi:hypothetical protein